MTDRPAAAVPTVLFTTGPLKPSDNPYLHQLVAAVGDRADIRFLTPRTALRTPLDVLHVHWPHQLVQGANPLRSVLKFLTSWVLLTRVRRRRIPVIWTVHNQTSHEAASWMERAIERRLEPLVSLRIYLNESRDNDTSRGVVLLHPRYDVPDAPTTPDPAGALLFGLLRPYKGIETLIAAAADAGVPTKLAGRPVDEEYADQIRALVATTSAVTLDARHVPEDELAALVRAHRLVVLPYRAMYNSGALLHALSLGVPLLAPASASNDAIRGEVGAAWLQLYDGDLTGDVLATAIERTAHRPATGPDLTRRDVATHGDLHVRAYRAVVAGPEQHNRGLLVSDSAFGDHSPLNQP